MEKTYSCFAAILGFLCCFSACWSKTLMDSKADEYALLAFKAHITFDPYNILANWSTGTSICSWIGVSCGLHHQRVTALNLDNMSLKGTITPHLGNLSFLQSLNISYNNFSGSFPEELAHLHRLELIDVRHNFLDGNIPEGIGNLTNLNFLSFSFNQLTGPIPPSVFNISSLQAIDLTSNKLSGPLPLDMCNHLPKLELFDVSLNKLQGSILSGIYRCWALQYLSLSFNEFNGSIPGEIGNLTVLKELFLGINRLQGMIPKEISNLSNLEILSIQSSYLTGPIPYSIFNISTLRQIDFANNSLSGSLPEDICYHLPLLEGLYLSNNWLTGQLPSGIWECRVLRSLSLSDNKLTGSISKKVGNLTLLKDLYIAGNNLTGILPDEIGNLNLKGLSVHGNKLWGLIPPNIFNISTITVIDLNDNHLSGHLPSSLGLWLPNLERLYMNTNKLSGIIPSCISNASKLMEVHIGMNSLTGFIPNTLGNLRFLKRLVLAENNLTREPSTTELRFFLSLTNCRNLETLEISLNQFNGYLPPAIGNLSFSLHLFQAWGSNIKGTIPNGIGNLSGLESISLDNNQLQGYIPTTLGRLKSLERLYLENNRLQGSIPNSLCQIANLGDLYLSGNTIHGPIPACLGEVKSLRRLFLHSNSLSSTIPSTLWSLEDLLGLNLSNNHLHGSLPPDVKVSKVLTQIDLSWNQLSGNIPSTFGGFQSLSSLSLAHNELQGTIPQSLGNLAGLEILDLSNNNLSGEIPKSLEALKYLQHLNLSFNKLQGEIPSGGHFANFTAQSFMHNEGLCGAPRLQVPTCNAKTLQSRSKKVALMKYILPSMATAIIVVALIFVMIRCRKTKPISGTNKGLSLSEWRRISYLEILQATNAFDQTNLLGFGGFGSVYKGTLSDGVDVAVKVFNLQVEEAPNSFAVECEVLRNIRHRNLVRIISCCSNMDFKALVLEYHPNGSLQKWLYSHNLYLDILQRLGIMIDIASALEYLHHGHTAPVVHCDLKPCNVLLDQDMIAHVADFGIAKLFMDGEFIARTRTLSTIGYMAPEYGMEGVISTKGDVYSYGILLMETFTRKKPTDQMFTADMSLRTWVSKGLDNSVYNILDKNLIEGSDEDGCREQCVSSLLTLALECSNDSPEERTNMTDVLARLIKIRGTFLSNSSMMGVKALIT